MFKTNVNHSNISQIGILARRISDIEKPFGRQTNLLQAFFNLTQNFNRNMLLFDPKQLMGSKSVCGLYFNGSKWIDKVGTHPKVLYDRFYSSMTGFDHAVLKLKRLLQSELNITYVNPIDLAITATDKNLFYKFSKRNGIRSPETLPLNIEPDKLWHFLELHPNIVIKPAFGRMGRGIARVNRGCNGLVFRSGSLRLQVKGKWHLWGMIVQFSREHQLSTKNLIMQPEIQIPERSSRYFDIRVLVQRLRGDIPPVIAGEVARIGGMNSHVPNIDHGGLALPLDDWLSYLYPHNHQNIIETLRSTALFIYEKLESEYGLIGELGIDLMLDKEARVNTIEVNSKPGRIAFERLASGFGLSKERKTAFANCRRDSIINPIKYAVWLAENEGRKL